MTTIFKQAIKADRVYDVRFCWKVVAASQRKDYFQNIHLCVPFLRWYPATIPVIVSLCIHSSHSPSCSHPTDAAVFSRSSELVLKPFSLLLPTLNYSNPLTGIGCCFCFCCFCSLFVCCHLLLLTLSLADWWLLVGGGWRETGKEWGMRGTARLCT